MNGVPSLGTVLLYLGAAILFVWGVAHIIPTRNVVAGFGPLTDDNRINISMEWVAEGLALAFAGLLAALVTSVGGADDPVRRVVVWAIVTFCVLMARPVAAHPRRRRPEQDLYPWLRPARRRLRAGGFDPAFRAVLRPRRLALPENADAGRRALTHTDANSQRDSTP